MEILPNVIDPNDGYFGWSIDIGDVSGDGLPDLVIGHPRQSGARAGGVNLHLGSPSGISSMFTMRVESPALADLFGGYVAVVGDVDDDGFGDVVVAGRPHVSAGPNSRSVWLLRGGPSGFVETIDWTRLSGIHATGAQGIGDIDADGHADVVLATAPGPGQFDTDPITLAVVRGVPGGLATTPTQVITPDPTWRLGKELVSGADINGDRRMDLIAMGREQDPPRLSRVAVFLGRSGGLVPTPRFLQEGGDLEVTNEGPADFAPDLDGDGRPELLIGEMLHDNPIPGVGRGLVTIRSGNVGGVDADPWMSIQASPRINLLGRVVAPAGDVDGDGLLDIVVFAAGVIPAGPPTTAPGHGAMFLHAGRPGGLEDLPSRYGLVEISGGTGVVSAVRAADLNADGLSDIVVGDPANRRVLVFFGSLPNTPPTCSSPASITGGCLGTLLTATATDAEDTVLRSRWTTTCPGARFTPSADVLEPIVAFDPYCSIDCDLVLTVRDGRCAKATSTTRVSFVDITPPIIGGVPPDDVVSCDAIPRPGTPSASDDCDPAPTLSLTEVRLDGACPWEYQLRRSWQAADECGNAVEASQLLRVVDDQAPVFTVTRPLSRCLWPPNGRRETIGLDQFSVSVVDGCDPAPTWRLVAVIAEEAGGFVEPDDGGVAADGTSVTLRVRRSGTADHGRTYRILAIARDACGNESATTEVGVVRVPHDFRPGMRCP